MSYGFGMLKNPQSRHKCKCEIDPYYIISPLITALEIAKVLPILLMLPVPWFVISKAGTAPCHCQEEVLGATMLKLGILASTLTSLVVVAYTLNKFARL